MTVLLHSSSFSMESRTEVNISCIDEFDHKELNFDMGIIKIKG